jgi:hypothetical protein
MARGRTPEPLPAPRTPKEEAVIEFSPKGKRYIMLRQGIGVFYKERNGRSVLRWETSWRKISGIWINTPWGCCWLSFRRTKLR